MELQKETVKNTDTKSRIFQAAAQLFARYGFERVSIRQICQNVGVQKPTLYYYFKDKETLILEMLRFAHQLVIEYRSQFIEPHEDFLDKMWGLLQGRKHFVENYPHFFRFYAMIHLFSTPEKVKQEMVTQIQPLLDDFRNLLLLGQQQGYIEPNEDVEILLQTILGTLNQLSVRKFVFHDEQAFSEENLQRVFNFWKKHLFVNCGK